MTNVFMQTYNGKEVASNYALLRTTVFSNIS